MLPRQSRSWRVDETYIKVRGKWAYLYRAVDKLGNTIDFYLSATRNTKAAKRFLGKALRGMKDWEQPEVLNTDKAPAYAAAIAELKAEGKCPKDTRHRQVKYLNNVGEADHGKLKLLIRPVRGFKTLKTAYATGIVDTILEADTDPDVPRKQRHTAHRIFERLRDEHGFTGGYTIVKEYVRSRRQSTREAFVPLHHPPGHAQVDFGEAVVELRGQREKIAFFCLILPHSDVWFVKAYPRETTEAFLDGHVSALAFLGGVPRSVLYDNTTLAVARILGDGTRRRTQAFTHLQSHYLFRDRFGRPGKGNDKGKVEALVKTARRRFMVPIPKVHDLSVLNERLLARCLERLDALEAGERATTLLADLDALRDLPAVPFEARSQADERGHRVGGEDDSPPAGGRPQEWRVQARRAQPAPLRPAGDRRDVDGGRDADAGAAYASAEDRGVFRAEFGGGVLPMRSARRRSRPMQPDRAAGCLASSRGGRSETSCGTSG